MAAAKAGPRDFAFQALALFASAVLVHGLYVTVVWPRSETVLSAQQARMQVDPNYVQDRSIWVILRDYEQESEIVLMLWALAIIGQKVLQLRQERRLLERNLVTLGPGMRILPQDVREHRIDGCHPAIEVPGQILIGVGARLQVDDVVGEGDGGRIEEAGVDFQ